MDQDILIVGLNEIGASIGLALARAGGKGTRTGYDPDSKVAHAARKAGAVERLALSLERGARDADVIILATAPAEVHVYLELLGPRLKPAGLVIDTSSLKLQAMQWASEHLPEGSYYVGAVPAVNPAALHIGAPGQGQPRADLFDGGLMAMVIPPRTPEAAVERTLQLVKSLNAVPFFLDAAEIDGVVATIEGLPALLGTALIRVALQSPGCREARRMAGRLFATSAIVGALQPPKTLQESLALNRDNVLRRLDDIMEELTALRALIATGEADALTKRLSEAVETHDAWLTARQRADWGGEELERVELPEGGVFDRVFGIGSHLRPKDHR